jgi:hypothetical protein
MTSLKNQVSEAQAMTYYSTILSQVVTIISRDHFQTVVNRYKGDHRVHNFSCWTQLVVMIYAQIDDKESLRDLETGILSKKKFFRQVGVENAPRSTIAHTNSKRNWKIYRDLFQELVNLCQKNSPKHTFRFNNKLQALDATTVKLCLKLFPWAKFRHRKGAIKIHTLYQYGSEIPSFINITDGKTHEIRVARELEFEPDSITVFDRGYIDFSWLYSIHQKPAYWLTRAKRNLSYVVVRKPEHSLPPLSATARKRGILKDQVIRIVGRRAKDIPTELRLVTYYDAEKKETFQYLTNIFHLSAWTVTQIYKARWEIEIFFKWIKQHLKIKTFLGTSENAVYTQIWIAMITYLLLAYIKHSMKSKRSLLEIHRLIRENMFERIRLVELLQMSKCKSNQKSKQTKSLCQQLFLEF